MFIDKHGEGVMVDPPLDSVDVTDRIIARFVEMAIAKFSSMGISHKKIGKMFGLGETTVRERLEAMPPETKAYYARFGIEGLVRARPLTPSRR